MTRLSREVRVLLAGGIAFTLVVAGWVVYWKFGPSFTAVFPVDLTVYRDGGLIVRGVPPYYDPHAASPLYDWGGYSDLALKFTYTPFAAVAFALASFLSQDALIAVSVMANIAALTAALWFTAGGLAYLDTRLRDDWRVRGGVTLLCTAAVLWTQPVLRTINLGQVNLVLMALIMWDLCQPRVTHGGRPRWWTGFATGVAAGVKLVPLVFVPYLLVTRRVREALVTVGGFLFTIAVGFAVLPSDSAAWWVHGVFAKGSRAGFLAWAGNQSLRGVLSRLSGSIAAGTVPWAVAAVVVLAFGLAAAALLSRAGHELPALLMTALAGLLASPISWDHHWVWIAPGFMTIVVYAWKYPGRNRRWLIGLAAGILAVFGAWPDALWESARNLGRFSLGLLWAPPNTNPILYVEHGDQPSFVEYHWHGPWLLTGNAYILAGLAMFLVLLGLAVTLWRRSRRADQGAGLLSPSARRSAGSSASRIIT